MPAEGKTRRRAGGDVLGPWREKIHNEAVSQ